MGQPLRRSNKPWQEVFISPQPLVPRRQQRPGTPQKANCPILYHLATDRVGGTSASPFPKGIDCLKPQFGSSSLVTVEVILFCAPQIYESLSLNFFFRSRKQKAHVLFVCLFVWSGIYTLLKNGILFLFTNWEESKQRPLVVWIFWMS